LSAGPRSAAVAFMLLLFSNADHRWSVEVYLTKWTWWTRVLGERSHPQGEFGPAPDSISSFNRWQNNNPPTTRHFAYPTTLPQRSPCIP